MFKLFDRQAPQGDGDPPVEGFGAGGIVTVKLYDKNGALKSVRGPMRNMVVQIGRSYILQQLGSANAAAGTKASCRWTGIGHSQTAAALGQTKLGTQKSRRLNTFTFASGNDYSSCICTFTSFGSGTKKSTIYESGLFWGSATQDSMMLARQTFSAVTKLSADTLTVEWKVSID